MTGCSMITPNGNSTFVSTDAGGYYESVSAGDVFWATVGLGLAVFVWTAVADLNDGGDADYEDYYE